MCDETERPTDHSNMLRIVDERRFYRAVWMLADWMLEFYADVYKDADKTSPEKETTAEYDSL